MIRYLFWGALAGAIVAAPAIAKADPDVVPYTICAELSAKPTIFNVTAVLDEIEAAGLTDKQAAGVMVEAVTSTCPQYLSLLQRYVDVYAPTPSTPPTPAIPAIKNEVVA